MWTNAEKHVCGRDDPKASGKLVMWQSLPLYSRFTHFQIHFPKSQPIGSRARPPGFRLCHSTYWLYDLG